MLGNLVSIPDYAFASCISLKTVKLGESIVTICSNAFDNTPSLRSIRIPSSVVTIATGWYPAFDDYITLYGDADSAAQDMQKQTVIHLRLLLHGLKAASPD